MSTYMWINILTISIPLIASFDKRLKFYQKWYALWPAILFTALVFIIWDIYFTHMQIWSFNPAHLMGINLFNLPIEEWLFFITIPYAIVFTYDSLKRVITIRLSQQFIHNLTILLAVILLTVAVIYVDRFYSSVTFFLTAMFLLMQIYIFDSKYLGHFYFSYLIIFMFPFLLVNGILTGSFVSEPVVMYNNAENLAIRVFTIPIEDFIYGMLLYLMNVTIYEKIQEFFEPAKSRIFAAQH